MRSYDHYKIIQWKSLNCQCRYPNFPQNLDIKDYKPYEDIIFMESVIKEKDAVNSELKQILLSKEDGLIESLPTGSQYDGGTGLGKNSLTSRFEKFNVLEWPEDSVKKLFSFFRDSYLEYLEHLKINRSKVYIQCWANILRKGERINYHVHDSTVNTYISGNYCVSAIGTETKYFSPFTPSLNYSFKNAPGSLILFPSYVPHAASRYENETEERITIAFDIFPEKVAEHMRTKRVLVLLDSPE